MSDYKLLQSLPAPAHNVVSTSQGSDGSVYTASGTEVWQLRPTPLLDQVCWPPHVSVSHSRWRMLLGRQAASDSISVKSLQRNIAPVHDRLWS